MRADQTLQSAPFELRYYQQEAVEAGVSELHRADRATLVMCCGSGKSPVAPAIAKRIQHDTVLVIAPTVMLLEQLKRYWNGVNDRTLIVDYDHNDNREELTSIASAPGSLTVLTTYVSSMECVQAIQNGSRQIDLVVYDEAHKTAGKFAARSNETMAPTLPISKRLFMTATPRHAEFNDAKDREFFSMDDPVQFGRICYEYPLRRAIEDGTVTDYRILLAGVTDAEVRDRVSKDHDFQTTAAVLALHQAIHEYGLRKIITYHPSIDDARSFAELARTLLPEVPVLHVSSAQTRAERKEAFALYENLDAAIVTNARVLGEGIDVPETDAVMYTTPKTSTHDIVQTSGRAIRRSPGKDFGYIIIPVLENPDLEGEEFGDFNAAIQVLGAMSENDSLLHDIITLRLNHPWEFEEELDGFVQTTMRSGASIDASALRNALALRMIKSVHATFFERLEQFRQHRDKAGTPLIPTTTSEAKNLGLWIKNTRRQFHKGLLSQQKIDLLNAEGFVWDVSEHHFQSQMAQLKHYLSQGHTLEEASTGPFAGFIKHVRNRHREGRLPDRQVEMLREVGLYFDVEDWRLKRNLQKLEETVTSGGSLVKAGLTDWIKYQRTKYAEGTLEEEIQTAFVRLGIPLEKRLASVFEQNLRDLTDLLAQGQPIPDKLFNFHRRTRTQARKGELSNDRRTLIAAVSEETGTDILKITPNKGAAH